LLKVDADAAEAVRWKMHGLDAAEGHTAALASKRKMKIQGFIFNWKGHEANAKALEEKCGRVIDVTVINSEECLKEEHKSWVHLDDSAYFSAQWNRAMELFQGDVLFHIQADATFNRFEDLFAKAQRCFETYPLGVYEPNVDFTPHQFRKSLLRELEAGVHEVPMTDCTCWFIAGDIARKLPSIDLTINRYGWGVSRAIAGLSRLSGKLCVRDYNFKIQHPRGTGYSSKDAAYQLVTYLGCLSPELTREMIRIEILSDKLRLFKWG